MDLRVKGQRKDFMKNPTTIKDIARRLGLSPSTVSRALSGHPDISEETREKVCAMARELDYHPNTLAKSLQQKESQIIGVVVPQVKHYFFASVMAGITDMAYQSGYTVMICQSNEDYQREVANLDVLISHRVAGLLVSVSSTTTQCEHFLKIKRRSIPLVFFDRVCLGIEASSVEVDDYEGAFRATEYLIQKGYKRIGTLTGPLTLSIAKARFEGFRDALKKHGMELPLEWVVHGGMNEEDGVVSVEKLLSQSNPWPDALFCVNDPVALGAMMWMKEKGIRIPDDIAMMGFTDNPEASMIEPPLTTMRQPAYLIGKTAAELLLDEIKNKKRGHAPVHCVLKTELVVRKSA